MTITSRPPYFAAVGGVFHTPVLYVLDTVHPYLTATLYDVQDNVLGSLQAASRNGTVKLDVAGFLRAHLTPELPTTNIVSTLPASALGYYVVFSFGEEELSEKGSPRYAVLAALPQGENDYQAYTV
jgi:hypothetical protein